VKLFIPGRSHRINTQMKAPLLEQIDFLGDEGFA
jgi:hypothetical protein